MTALWTLPFALQGAAIAVDEFYFHRRRGLTLWERAGHPLDTLSLLACLGIALFAPFGELSVKLFAALAALSCLLVTKDEFVHARSCEGAEHWLHAVLFVLHPLVLVEVFFLWPAARGAGPWLPPAALPSPDFARLLLAVQAVAIAAFFVFQVTYWFYGRQSERGKSGGQ